MYINMNDEGEGEGEEGGMEVTDGAAVAAGKCVCFVYMSRSDLISICTIFLDMAFVNEFRVPYEIFT